MRRAIFNWSRFEFLFPAGAALVAAILLALFFHPPRQRAMQMIADDEELTPPAVNEGQIAAGFPKDERGIRR